MCCCVVEGWWFVYVQDSDQQGWAPASCLLPENREEFNEVAESGNVMLDLSISMYMDVILFYFLYLFSLVSFIIFY